MSKRARIDIKGYYYHIIARGQRKNPIFFSENDYKSFLKILDYYLNKFDIELYAYCLMRNHYHLLIKRNEDSLKRLMLPLQTAYALFFNKKYKKNGYVFQGRYRSFIVLNEKYLIHLINYIHYNPVKAHIVRKRINYKFSSAIYYEKSISILKNIKKLPLFKTIRTNRIKKFIDNENDYIGTINEFLKIEKRTNNRNKGKFIERRGSISRELILENEILKYCVSNNVKLYDFIGFQRNSKKRKEAKKIVKYLTEKGFYCPEIAVYLKCHKSTIARMLHE